MESFKREYLCELESKRCKIIEGMVMQKNWYLMTYIVLFLNCDSFHARVNNHYKAWSYKKRKHKMIKILQSVKITSKPPSIKRNCNQFSQFWRTSTKVIPIERLKLATFRQWTKGSREAASEGPTVLHIHFCSLSSNSKQQLRAPAQTWQQFSIHGCMVDL